ncbi:MAG: hypothetical protein AAGA99_18640 [Actinomycetota bacterium]
MSTPTVVAAPDGSSVVAPAVLVAVDASDEIGMGHLMRSLAVVEELVERGRPVEVLVPRHAPGWGRDRLEHTGAKVITWTGGTSQLAERAVAAGLLVVDLPTEDLDRLPLAELEARAPTVVLDDEGGVRPVSAVSTSHPLGDELPWDTTPSTRRLVGVGHCLLRRAVRDQRPSAPSVPPQSAAIVLGGADVARLADRLAGALLDRDAIDVTVVAADADMAVRLAELDRSGRLHLVPGGGEPAPLLAAADLVVCTASTVMWEACSMGRVVATVPVVPGQVPFGRLAVDAGAVALLDPGDPTTDLHALLDDHERCCAIARSARALIDGRGVERLADAIDELGGHR